MAIYCTSHEHTTYSEKNYWRTLPEMVPSVTFHTRIYNDVKKEFEWLDVNTWDIFAGERILMFSLPGAFTPTCSTYQLPGFEQLAEEFYAEGITGIVCMTVNDAFVCNAWAKANNLKHVQVIPDGACKFTEAMNMAVDKDSLGFGRRSWRYACIVENGTIEDWFIEEGREDNRKDDPYMFTNPEYILQQIRGN